MQHMMDDLVEGAKEELKRADHSIYITLKYTRTVDVIKNIIKQNFHWGGRGMNFKELNKLTIKLPVDDDNQLDWKYMENYIKNLDYFN